MIKPVSYQTGLGDSPKTPAEQEAANRARLEEQQKNPPVPGANQQVQAPATQPANNPPPQQNPQPAQNQQPQQNPQQAPATTNPGTDKPVDDKAPPVPPTAPPVEGVPWDTPTGNGGLATSVIVPGTGGQTIDTTIRNADGTITQMRSVSNGQGGVTTWTANADGSYAVRYPDGTNGADLGKAKIYTVPAGGDPASPAPMEADISADGKRVETPSYDVNGNRVGTDVGVLNEQGLYNNYHHDNYGNVLITQAAPNGKGGVDSTLVGGIDSDGSRWHLDKTGKRWSLTDDGQGNTYLSRTEQGKDGLHWLHTNKAGLLIDEFRGKGEWYEDTYNLNGTRTRRYADKSETIFDANGKPIGHNNAPDDRMAWEKVAAGAITGGTALGGMAIDVVAYPFRKVTDGMAGMSSIRVTQNGVMTTYQPPDREKRLAEIGGAFVRPVVGSVEYLAGNLTDFMATTSTIRVGSDGIGSTYQRPDRENALIGDLIGVTPKEIKENPWESVGLLSVSAAVGVAGLRFGRGPRSPKPEEPTRIDPALGGGTNSRMPSWMSNAATRSATILDRVPQRLGDWWARADTQITEFIQTKIGTLDSNPDVAFAGTSWRGSAAREGAIMGEIFADMGAKVNTIGRALTDLHGRALELGRAFAQSVRGGSGGSGPGGGTGGAGVPPLNRAQLANDIFDSSTRPRVRDLDEWLKFHQGKTDAQFPEVLHELYEVQRLLAENPGMHAVTSLERFVLKRPGTDEALPEFDVGLLSSNSPSVSLTRGGPVLDSRVEIAALAKPVKTAQEFTAKIHHGIDKAVERVLWQKPMSGELGATIYARVYTGSSTKGQLKEWRPDGTFTARRPDGTLIKEENLFDELLGNLPAIKNINYLDRVTIVNPDTRAVLAEYIRSGQVWSRIR